MIYEIEQLSSADLLSLQRLRTVPIEKLFEMTRLHAKAHQTLSGILNSMKRDQALRLLHASKEVRKRKLAYCEVVHGLSVLERDCRERWNHLLPSEAFLEIIGFSVTNFQEFRLHMDQFEMINQCLETCVILFVPNIEGTPTRLSLYEELLPVMPSTRHLMLTAKRQLRKAVKL
jgi:hypothetical protein